MSQTITPPTVSRHPTARAAGQSIAQTVVLAALGAALITASAKIQVPFWPVPMTLHTLAVMAIAVAGGPRLAVAALAAYLAAGAAGLPVFSGTPERGIGLAYMAGPTGGYLLGYLLSGWVTGTLARGRGAGWRGTLARVGAMLAGLAVIYAAGLAWLALYVPAGQLVALGFTPFILGDLVKVAVVAVAAHGVVAWRTARGAGRGA